MQGPNRMHSSMPSDKKIQQDEDGRNPSFMQLQKEKLSIFWKQQKEEILHSDPKRKHELPISRIKRAMKSNDQVQVGGEANDGQGNEAYLNFQPNDIPVEGNTDDGQDNEFHPAYQMVQLDNIPCQFQVQKKAKYGQGNKFQSRELKLLSKALIEVFDVPAHHMVQPNNVRASSISIPGTPVPSSPEAEFNIDEYLVDNEEDL